MHPDIYLVGALYPKEIYRYLDVDLISNQKKGPLSHTHKSIAASIVVSAW